MKRLITYSSIFMMFTAFWSCEDTIKETYQVNEPVYLKYSDLRESFAVKPGEDIVKPGKIYFMGDYIFVNEYLKGIHIVNNADPSNPQVIKFLEIPGNVDMAIKGNMLYADSYVDLLTINIGSFSNIHEVDRDTNAFPYIIPEVGNGIIEEVDMTKGVIIDYKVVEKTEEIEDVSNNFLRFERFSNSKMEVMMTDFAGSPTGGSSGKSGSMARFTIHYNYLYAIDNNSLKIFNISDTRNPVHEKDEYVGWNIETLFPYENNLFIGSQSGMFIYDITIPSEPTYISQFNHMRACDPVVVENGYAYVTLRGGNACGGFENQLDVIDISNIHEPKLVKTYPMEGPYGLGIDNNTLFVCDGEAGLKIYDATDKENIDNNKLSTFTEMNAFDVIPLGNVLLLISIDGLYQYDYSSLDDIKLLSHIPIYNKE